MPPLKKIVIDSYPITTPYVGVGEFCRQIGKRLSKRALELRSQYGIEIYFILPPKFKGYFGADVHYLCIPATLRGIVPFYPIKADLFHIPYQYNKIKNLSFAKKQLLTIHDINFIYEKKDDELKKAINKFTEKINKTDYISYISEFACKDTEKHFNVKQPKRIIYNGVTDLSNSPQEVTLPANLPKNFLFHLSSLLPKKNVHLLVEMMKYLPDYNLVIAGNWNSDYAQKIKQEIADNNINNIYTLSNVTESEKAALYKLCRAFLFPSLCEGFGLPPIEAMKFGKPVFLSKLTSLPEIGGNEAFYWENLYPQKMAEVLRNKLALYDASDGYSDRLKKSASRFDWDNCVNQYIKYYLEILNIKE